MPFVLYHQRLSSDLEVFGLAYGNCLNHLIDTHGLVLVYVIRFVRDIRQEAQLHN